MKVSLGRFKVGPQPCHCALHRGQSINVTVEVEVDPAALTRYLGPAAIHNKSRYSTEAGGRVMVKVSNDF